MLKAWSITKLNQAGFSVVEVLLAVTLFGSLVTALTGAVIYGRSSAASAGDHDRAALLAQEGLAASRNIGDASFASLADGTYGLTQTSGQWAFSGTSDTTGNFTRQITISSNGSNRKLVTSTVTWPQAYGGNGTVTLTSELTDWFQIAKSWANATLPGSINISGNTDAIKVATAGNYAYVIENASSSNFLVVDISNPSSPTLVSTSSFTNIPSNITVSGNYAYLTTNTNTTGLEIIDISNPSAPSLVKSVSMTGSVASKGVAVSGNYAYVVRASSTTSGANEFTVVNISNPATASVVGGYNNNIQMNEVYVSGNYAYVATSSTTQEMLVINISTPTAPTLAATYNPSTTLTAVTITGFGSTVLLGMGTTLDAINVATPTAPVRLGTFTAGGTINDIDVDSTHKYAFMGTANTSGEIQIVDVSNPASIAQVSTVDVPGTSSTVGGVSYDATWDVLVGASASNNQEVVTVTKG